MVTEQALLPVIDLNEFPNAVVDVFIELPQCDSGTRCAGICAAAMALADAGIPMANLVQSIAVGKVGDKLVVDLTKEEEDYPDGATDMALSYISSLDHFTHLQVDGHLTPDELQELLKLAKKACAKIEQVQRQALRDKYGKEQVVDDE